MLNAKVAELLNDQINKELYSAYLYLDFAIYYEERGFNVSEMMEKNNPM